MRYFKLILFALSVVMLFGCQMETVEETSEQVEQMQKPAEQPVQIVQEKTEPVTMTLAMVGDILLHDVLTGYSEYVSSFEPVMEQMQSYDFLLANQESLPVGNRFPLDGYPQFASPDFLLRDLKIAGVDLINLANNHVVDKGEAGVTTLFENVEKYEMPYIGAFSSQEDAAEDRILEKDGLQVGLLSYTYSTNGLFLPEGSPYIINYIDEPKIIADISAMKEKVDVVTVIMHWGPEFTTQHNQEQTRLAQLIHEAGADIIFGMHPHVLQPYEKLVAADGHETHVFYSLGNYFSKTITSDDSLIGGIASLVLTKTDDGVSITDPTLFTTAMLLDADDIYRVYPLAGNEQRAVQNMEWVKRVMGEGINAH